MLQGRGVHSMRAALVSAFPELKKKIKPRNYWRDRANRQQFLTQFAAELGFDPYNLENWAERQITNKLIIERHVCRL